MCMHTCCGICVEVKGKLEVLILPISLVWSLSCFLYCIYQGSWPARFWGFSGPHFPSPCRKAKTALCALLHLALYVV